MLHDADGGWFPCFLGENCRITLHSDQFLGRLSQIEVMAAQGDGSASMLHHDASVLVNVVSGSINLRLGSERRERLGQGGTIFLPSDTTYCWDCAEAPARILLTYAPGGIESVLRACADRSREDQIAAAHSYGTELLFDRSVPPSRSAPCRCARLNVANEMDIAPRANALVTGPA